MIRLYDPTKPWDFGQAMKIANAMMAEGAFHGVPLSTRKIELTLQSPKTYKAFGMVEGVVAGAVVGGLVPHWFSDALMGMEYIHYVYPEFRGTDVAALLLDAFEEWAFGMGAKGIYVEQMSGIDPDRAQSFYRRQGYERVGVLMQKGLTRVQP